MKFNVDPYLIIGIIALLYLCCSSTLEHMSNSDVQKKLEHHKTATTWDSVHKKPESKKTESTNTNTNQLRGPQTHILSEAEKEKDQPKATSETKAVDYPSVYGPDVNLVPGHKDDNPNHDSHNPEPYDFIPAADFPKGPVAPSPFLTDFSKIMK